MGLKGKFVSHLYHAFAIPIRPGIPLDMPSFTWHDHEVHRSTVALLFLAYAATSLVAAQTTTARRTVWDGVYTEAQAARGATAFGLSCSRCHTLAAAGQSPLAGDAFWKSFAQKSVGDLLDYVSANMPNGAGGSLNETAYRDIVAALLKANDFPAGSTELARDTIASVQIIPKDGSKELPANALVRVVGCLARRGPDWVVIRATTPERAEAPHGEDATRVLGSHTFALKYVVTRLDALAGSRVAVNGLQIGAGGVDGLNVTAVSRVADRCP
jgi:S-disulfanyl-L-cysteine oxidoreductase SoxD